MKYEINGREVEVTDTDFMFGEGCYVISAQYTDDGTELTDEECEALTDAYQSELYQDAYEHQAAAAYDRAKDYMKYGE